MKDIRKMKRVRISEVKKREKKLIILLDTNNILWRTAAVSVKFYEKDMVRLRNRIMDGEADYEDQIEYDKYYSDFIKVWRNTVFTMIRGIVHTHKPNHVIICRDASYTWRNVFFDFYKGKRRLSRIKNDRKSAYSSGDFYKEIEKLVAEINEVLCYYEMKCPLMEADDIIGILSQTINKKYDIIISSTDKDFADLITDDGSVKFYEHSKKVFLTKDDKANFDEMILCGDDSDGIPRMFDCDDSIVRFEDFTEEQDKLPQEEKDKIKRKFVEADSDERPSFGIAAAKKILVECKKRGITLEDYAKEKGVYDRYLRNKVLFSLRLEDYKKYNPGAIQIVKTIFLGIKNKKQNFIEMQKYFAKNRIHEQVDHIKEFILQD